jgi:hypothetical protein
VLWLVSESKLSLFGLSKTSCCTTLTRRGLAQLAREEASLGLRSTQYSKVQSTESGRVSPFFGETEHVKRQHSSQVTGPYGADTALPSTADTALSPLFTYSLHFTFPPLCAHPICDPVLLIVGGGLFSFSYHFIPNHDKLRLPISPGDPLTMVPRTPDPPLSVMTAPVLEEQNDEFRDACDLESLARPEAIRRATAPESPSAVIAFPKPLTPTSSLRSRNGSPFRKTHLRSKSSAGSLSAPLMTRAHSSPDSETGIGMLAPIVARSLSPLPSGRHRSPLRISFDGQYLTCGEQVDIDETISENSELHLTPRVISNFDGPPSSPAFPIHHTFPRVRRRPSSPLHPGSQSILRATVPISVLRTSTSSPSLSAAKFNEPYPSNYSVSSSSIPSTPTSFRSRSPSISSLETIPDSPDAELEAENIAQLKAAADKENEVEVSEGFRRRGMGEIRGRPEATRDKGKRWSVCGAERRGDLDLETIWED